MRRSQRAGVKGETSGVWTKNSDKIDARILDDETSGVWTKNSDKIDARMLDVETSENKINGNERDVRRTAELLKVPLPARY